MNVYKKVLVELEKEQSFKAQINNLIKLEYETEDYELKKRIVSWVDTLHNAEIFRQRKLPNHTRELLAERSPVKQELRDYCTTCIQSQQPEWQILALRYGWRPMN